MDKSSLYLLDQNGTELSNITDVVKGKPKKEDGIAYQDVTLTVPWSDPIIIALNNTPAIGMRLYIFDKRRDEVVHQFVFRKLLMTAQPKSFLKVTGRIYLALQKPPGSP
jgi:hypothetical protein